MLHIFATPKASKTEIAGLHGIPQRIKIRIAAPPVEGAANEELLRYLKKLLKVPARQLVIESGHSSKFKDVLCIGLSESECLARLTPFLPADSLKSPK